MTRGEKVAWLAVGGVLALAWRVRQIDRYLHPPFDPRLTDAVGQGVGDTGPLLVGKSRPISYWRPRG